jgi:hypothetical protein
MGWQSIEVSKADATDAMPAAVYIFSDYLIHRSSDSARCSRHCMTIDIGIYFSIILIVWSRTWQLHVNGTQPANWSHVKGLARGTGA